MGRVGSPSRTNLARRVAVAVIVAAGLIGDAVASEGRARARAAASPEAGLLWVVAALCLALPSTCLAVRRRAPVESAPVVVEGPPLARRARPGRVRDRRHRIGPRVSAPPAAPEPDAGPASPSPAASPPEDAPIAPHAVASLLASLAHRDAATAAHSRRVADLCVATARGLLSGRDCRLLEAAGLLHDVGKLGVPDSVLDRPGPLSPSEWDVLRSHDRIGAEIIAAAFSSAPLRAIVAGRQARFDADAGDGDGGTIATAARILAIADAYDAMVRDRPFRPARTPDEALAELRRCAGTQFDPALVERFAGVVSAPGRDPVRAAAVLGPLPAGASAQIGRQIGRLAAAVDARDAGATRSAAARLLDDAHAYCLTPLAELAGRLDQAAIAGPDWPAVAGLVERLLDLGRVARPADAPGRRAGAASAQGSR